MATEQELLTVKEKYKNELLARPGLHAVGVGVRERGGVLTKELAIVCFVEKKLDLTTLNPDDVIPPLLDGIPTDVQESPMFEPFATDSTPLAQQVRPVIGGLKLTPGAGPGFGTLGWIGLLNNSTTMVAVSNQHVLQPQGTTDFQPDNGKHNDIGTTTKVVLSPKVDGGYTTLTTTGVAAVYKWGENGYTPVPIAGGAIIDTSQLPYPVWKTGATTGTVTGNITALHVSGDRVDGWHFEDQMTIRPDGILIFALPGDSGSAVVSSSNNRIVGLLWGGVATLTSSRATACPIAAVNTELGLTFPAPQPQQLQEPVVVPPAEELLARLKSDQGRRIASFLSEHGPEVRGLIYTDRRVLETWTRHHGHEICNAIIENVALKSTPLPATMAGAPTKPALEEFGGVLIERGSPALGSAIEAVRADIEWLIDRPYADAASES